MANNSSWLLFIGKSNKHFTHGWTYQIYGYYNDNHFSLILFDNKKNMKKFSDSYCDYVEKNFKMLSDNEYKTFVRKNKLKNISKI
jgi:adenine C2-methylase RlmN of 23S rRNA A2503 and tRNA A37